MLSALRQYIRQCARRALGTVPVGADQLFDLARRAQDSIDEINNILNMSVSRITGATATLERNLSESNNAIKLSDEVMEAFVNIESAVR